MASCFVGCKLILLVAIALQSYGLPIDEELAISNDMAHGRANPRGANAASGHVVDDGERKAVVVQYDMLFPLSSAPPKSAAALKQDAKRSSASLISGGGQRRSKRGATPDDNKLWPGGVVPYKIWEWQYSNNQINMMHQAMALVSQYTCITFVPQDPAVHDSWITLRMISSTGCASYIGKQGTGYQYVFLRDCFNNVGLVAHELLHAVGIIHQHNRFDRNNYVTVNWGNIKPAEATLINFGIDNTALTYNRPYDYRSVMHYSQYTFTKSAGLPTVTTTDPAYQSIIGTASDLSYEDVWLVNTRYQCSSGCPSITCPSNGFVGPDCTCLCSSGLPSSPIDPTCETCAMANVQCTCENRANPCAAIPNSHCSSGACVCDSGYTALTNGQCVLTSSLTCSAVGSACSCDLQYGTPCSGLSNTVCDTITGACECDVNYYNNAGQCTLAPACTTPGQQCHCEVQGASACSGVPYSFCNAGSGACQCLDGSTGSSCGLAYGSDGSSVSPFIQDAQMDVTYPLQVGSSDYAANGFPSNGWTLAVSRIDPSSPALPQTMLILSNLPSPTTVSHSAWCVDFAAKLNYAFAMVVWSIDGGPADFTEVGQDCSATQCSWQNLSAVITDQVSSSINIAIVIGSGGGNNGLYDAFYDSIVVKPCQ